MRTSEIIQFCRGCGALQVGWPTRPGRPLPICPRCSEIIFEPWRAQTRLRRAPNLRFPVLALGAWQVGEGPEVGQILRAQKGGRDPQLSRILGRNLFQLLFTHLHGGEGALCGPFNLRLVVPPCSGPSNRNHALELAVAMREYGRSPSWDVVELRPVAAPVENGFEDSTCAEQKSRTRAARWGRHFQKIEHEGGALSAVHVFVDDVLTTGATANAAWEALGRPKAFLAIVCFVRARVS